MPSSARPMSNNARADEGIRAPERRLAAGFDRAMKQDLQIRTAIVRQFLVLRPKPIENRRSRFRPQRIRNLLPALELLRMSAIFPPCRYTSFIAVVVKKIAKSWCVPRVGRGRSAPIAAPPSWRRSCRFSLRAWAGTNRPRPAPCRAAVVVVAVLPDGLIRTKPNHVGGKDYLCRVRVPRLRGLGWTCVVPRPRKRGTLTGW